MNTLIKNYVTLINRARVELARLEREYKAGGSPVLQSYRAKWMAHYEKTINLYSNYINALQS